MIFDFRSSAAHRLVGCLPGGSWLLHGGFSALRVSRRRGGANLSQRKTPPTKGHHDPSQNPSPDPSRPLHFQGIAQAPYAASTVAGEILHAVEGRHRATNIGRSQPQGPGPLVMAEREPCAFCGDEHWTEAHFAAGRLVCQLCWNGRAPAVAMPPTEAGKRAIASWLRPRTSTPAMQLSFNQRKLVQPQGVQRG